MSSLTDILHSMAQLDRDIDSAELDLQTELTTLVQTTVNRRFASLKQRVHQMRVLVNRFVGSSGDPDGVQKATTTLHQDDASKEHARLTRAFYHSS